MKTNSLRVALPLLTLTLLASCGGGRVDTPQAGPAEATQRKALAAGTAAASSLPVLPGTVPTDANLKGVWSDLKPWPLVAVHAALLPDGRILSYGSKADGQQTGSDRLDLWDNAGNLDGGHNLLSNTSGTDLFCGSQLLLPPSDATTAPQLFMAGGDNYNGTSTSNTGNSNSNVWSSTTRTLTRGPEMTRARWYSTSVTLASGETYIQGGNGGTDRPEIRAANGSFRSLSTADTSSLVFQFPRNFVQPDGRVFGFDGNGAMYVVDASGTGAITKTANFAGQYAGSDNSAAMFRPGRVLAFGGNSNGAIVIDATNPAAPVVTPTQSMVAQRRLGVATLLPSGEVLATGGSPIWNNPVSASLNAEIWSPTNGQWAIGSDAARPRLYHSNAMLLPDATVLVTGGGAAYGGAVRSSADNELNAQIYHPPYLFTAGGGVAVRPAIVSAPSWLDIGKRFSVTTDSPVSRVVLIKNGSATHGFNLEQRFVELAFSANGNTLTVQAPTRGGEATPGYYMLFVLNAAGTPSTASMVRVGVAAATPAGAPSLTAVADRSVTLGQATTLQLTGSVTGGAASYSAGGLPPGLSLNPATGLISGTPTAAGSFHVVVAVSDGVNGASRNFVWTVAELNPLTLTTVPTPTATAANGTVSFTAQASGTGVEYQWNFGDGRADTAWSSSNTVSTSYSAPGTFVVTLRVRDAAGHLQSRSFLQRIHLPSTANAPTASTNLLLEQPTTGNARLWVVNQDNDSVTAFDAVTRAKLGEVAVGSGPRSIARASSGLLWVTNKFDGTVSVIDPATRTVTRTLALPRGSQPFGVAVSPVGPQAFVALEAWGQVLRFDSDAYTQTGALSVGLNVRHLSVSADGVNLYATRFITRPVPGEATATVNTTGAGGEVLQITAASMTLAKTWLLAHSERTDAENQGRGLPNYLGAAVISPDGSQAYVPSKQDNIKRGALRDGNPLNFQNTVRAISSRLVLSGTGAGAEDLARRVDHDNASMASAAIYDARGSLLFVALETARQVAVVDAFSGQQLLRIGVGMAPQGLALSTDGNTLFVHNFMDRSVNVFDLKPLLSQGLFSVPLRASLKSVGTEKLSAQVLRGKQLFYDAKDTRLARDSYMSCAACHNDGGHDGRVWDLTHAGEGLRNTIPLRGRAGGAQGRLHWSGNFDEVQDFEGQIRALAGGTGLMNDTAYNAGTRSQPLGDAKAGQSGDLDALAAYLGSLTSFAKAPARQSDGSLTATAALGKTLFEGRCLACHGGAGFTASATSGLINIGTLKASSGQRLGAALTGIDPPTLRDVWATAPYLHDGSAATISAAISAHNNLSLTATELSQLAAFVEQIGGDEADMSATRGLQAQYFNNMTLSGAAALTRVEAVDFDWGTGSPGAGVNADAFSVRWAGRFVAPATGSYLFQTESDDGVRLKVAGNWVINNWTNHSPTVDTSAAVSLTAGQSVELVMEYFENGGGAVARLRWQAPGASAFVAMPAALFQPISATAPALADPGSPVSVVGLATSLQLSATDASGATLTYGATGLPAGLSLNPTTGLISGTPTAAASSAVTVTASNASGAQGSRNFTWVVKPQGLVGQYFNNKTLTGTPVLTRSEAVDFAWGSASPGTGVNADTFSARWTGRLLVPTTGSYKFQTESDDGVRLSVNGTQVINNWTNHGPTLDNSAAMALTAGQTVTVSLEYYDNGGGATMKLRWLRPGATAFEVIPLSALLP